MLSLSCYLKSIFLGASLGITVRTRVTDRMGNDAIDLKALPRTSLSLVRYALLYMKNLETMDKAVVIYKHFQEISLERSFNNQVTEIRKINIIYNILKKG